MKSRETEALATRVSVEEAEHVREVVEHTSLSKSDLLARALRYYMAANPDEIPAFRSNNYRTGPLEEAGIMSPPGWDDWPGLQY